MNIPALRVSCVADGPAVHADGRKLVCESPSQVAEIVRAHIGAGEQREHFVALFLNCRNKVVGIATISIGTLSASLVHPREVFRPAIVSGAAAIIIAHNHPSGDCAPSAEDKEVTRRLKTAAGILGIQLLDHVIVTDDSQFSFRETGAR